MGRYRTFSNLRGNVTYPSESTSISHIGRPTGVSPIHAQHRGDLYTQSFVSYDNYAGDNPKYVDGMYGNLYKKGGTAGTEIGMYPADNQPDLNPDFEIVDDNLKRAYRKVTKQSNVPDSDISVVGLNENFTPEKKSHKNRLLKLFVLFIGFITLQFWSTIALKILSDTFKISGESTLKSLFIYAICSTLLFLLLVTVFNFSPTIIEDA